MRYPITKADYIIIGGGIAGACAGYDLCKTGRVILLEKESQPGYHSTGRSSAIFQKSYNGGDVLLNRLVRASEDFLRHPPPGFCREPLLTPRSLIYIARGENQQNLDELHQNLSKIEVPTRFVGAKEALEILPLLHPDYQQRILVEPGIADIDVNSLHQGYLKAMKMAGGKIVTNAQVTNLTRCDRQWRVTTGAGDNQGHYQAPVVVNAAGAWVDEIAALADIAPINIRPLRRTVIMVTPPENIIAADWPMVMDPAGGYYFKPEQGKILVTPGDEKLMPPCDIQPDEIDIARGAYFLETATDLKVAHIDHSWAGLRNQVKDGYPVVGFEPNAPGFFWLAGQGGYGIKTAPAMGRITASLIAGAGLPKDMRELGLQEGQISVTRLRQRVTASAL